MPWSTLDTCRLDDRAFRMPNRPNAARRRAGAPSAVPRWTRRQAIIAAWILCGALDIVAAFALSWFQAGRTPPQVLEGVASALLGREAIGGGPVIATVGLAMHFGVALLWTLVGAWLMRRISVLVTAPLWLMGPAYGAFVFLSMKFAVLPITSWIRSLYLDTPVTWPAALGWPLFWIHLVCVGTPIVWALREDVR